MVTGRCPPQIAGSMGRSSSVQKGSFPQIVAAKVSLCEAGDPTRKASIPWSLSSK